MSKRKTKIQSRNTSQKNITERKSKMDSPASNQLKKIWSFNALVAAMEPSTEELEYRKEKLGEFGFLQKYSKFFKCTKCQLNIKPHIVKHEKISTHPCLGVLMCEGCCNYYQDGEFSLDSDGEEKYCRWCGEGGTIFSCSNCICGFCLTCIKLHFKTDYLKQVQKDENWLCFFCNPKPLWEQRFICSLALKLSGSIGLAVSSSFSPDKEESITSFENLSSQQNTVVTQKGTKSENRTFKRKKMCKIKKKCKRGSRIEIKNNTYKLPSGSGDERRNIPTSTSSSDESDLENPKKRVRHTSTPMRKLQGNIENDSFESIKDDVLSKLKKILSLSEHEMNFGVTWSNNMLNKLSGSGFVTTHEGLVNECQKIKQVLSTMSAYLNQFSKSVDSVEKTLHRNDGEKVLPDFPSKDQSGYTSILQFLGFIKSQVKTLMEKGISLSDIFEAELYDDDKVIGLKKKTDVTSNQSRNESHTTGNNFDSNKDNGTKNKETLENKAYKFCRGDDRKCDVVVESKEDYLHVEEEDDKDNGSSNTTFVELNDIKSADPKDDIREILAILENA